MPTKHQKHTKLSRPQGGKFHSNEWTVIGAPCSVLKDFVVKISEALAADNISCAYLDMSHQAEELKTGPVLVLEDKLNHWTIKNKHKLHDKDFRKQFLSVDALFVNGNHYEGDQQIVFVHQKKKESLERKLDRLSNVKMVILGKGETQYHSYLEEYIKSDTIVISIEEWSNICEHLCSSIKTNLPQLKGLVLSGGKSQRMGTSKSELSYHGREQKEYEADLLNKYCVDTFYSVAASSSHSGSEKYAFIPDSFIGLGPYGGILSAFRSDPNSAWLTLACDLPYLDERTIAQLITARNCSKLATCFYNPETDFPEPLIAIWEPRAYPILLDFLSQGYSCPRKVLINSEIEMIHLQDPLKLKNVNTPEEKEEAEKYIKDFRSSQSIFHNSE